MAKVSAVMIVKNESANLKRCLPVLSWTDEIVVLDTGSEDDTIDLAQSFGCKTAKLDVWEGFGKAKQKAVSLAENDWILSLDADELLSEDLQEELKALSRQDFLNCAWRLKRKSFYEGKLIHFCGWQNDCPLRVFNRLKGNFNDLPVHEGVKTEMEKRCCKGILYHYPYTDKETHYQKMRFYGELRAKELKSKGKKSNPFIAALRGILKFLKMYILQLGFLDGRAGFLLCTRSAWGVWYKYHYLWKLSQ
ncbi:MAG: glycosyltransferase family 2 protein [Candidatus Cloacimonetes bacterium]|nr:glycosyltransferase family 2 protein [Candidatus Cloacimonadota bacterium]